MKIELCSEEDNVVLLATDVAARGLDIKGIQHVFHYQIPKTAEVSIVVVIATAKRIKLNDSWARLS